ncbi:MAG TPA: cobyric acid synthase [Thermotogota bacterium]|nr:cobyric acid synthase [Thermotogota bacterium]HPJ89738.1 cobyric acid synthase [Thermotogota bacterium]HPR95998.1 cobyric acid synthase [Thermotogota bacterium]
MGKPIMIVGTASGAGKSLTCTALCRILKNRGYNVAPFKMQNMSLNSICSYEGLEMSVAQYIQSVACGKAPSVVYNPILLKPENGETYVVFEGNFIERIPAASYMTNRKKKYFDKGIQTLKKLIDENDFVIIEGAGSPAEVNLMKYDVTNMAVAKAVKADTYIVTDIDRGGSFASLVGTMEIFGDEERNLIKGFIFNKFRGIREMLNDGFDYLENRYGVKTVGVVPMIGNAIPEEDSLQSWESKTGDIDICVIKTPFISNFSDFSPLSWFNGVRYVDSAKEVRGDLIILPGSKRTADDLKWLKETGIDWALSKAKETGSFILGICGGFQILGESIIDEYESGYGEMKGLGMLPVKTIMNADKRTTNTERVIFWNNTETIVRGYEIRHGETFPTAEVDVFSSPVNDETGFRDVIVGTVAGTYLHGLFYNYEFTAQFLNYFREKKGLTMITAESNSLDREIEAFSSEVEKNLEIDELLRDH